MIPVDGGDGAGVIWEIPADGGGDVSKVAILAVEKSVIGLASAEGFIFMKEAVEGLPAELITLEASAAASGIERGLRNDLPPVNTSQIAAVFCGDEAIGG